MKNVINRISFVLTWLCLLGLACGMIYEARTHALIFGDYISTFFAWALIFGIANYCTRLRTIDGAPDTAPDDPPESH